MTITRYENAFSGSKNQQMTEFRDQTRSRPSFNVGLKSLFDSVFGLKGLG